MAVAFWFIRDIEARGRRRSSRFRDIQADAQTRRRRLADADASSLTQRGRSDSYKAGPMFVHSSRFSCESAGAEDDPGSDIPIASIADAIVFAVYMPPHAPAPGHAFRMTSLRSPSSIVPLTASPYA